MPRSEAVDICFDTTDTLLAFTSGTGSFSGLSFTVPAGALPGRHWITAIGRKAGDGEQVSMTVSTAWSEHGFNVRGKRTNPYENVLSTGNVSSLDIAWTAATGSAVISCPAVTNGIVYVGSGNDKLYAFNATTGAQLWTATTGYEVSSSPAVANGIVYVGSRDYKLYAFNAAEGAPLWTATTGNEIQSSPAIANGIVYVGSDDGRLYAFALNGGTNEAYHRSTLAPSFWMLHPDWRLKPIRH